MPHYHNLCIIFGQNSSEGPYNHLEHIVTVSNTGMYFSFEVHDIVSLKKYGLLVVILVFVTHKWLLQHVCGKLHPQ